jgi:hypothetical protein
MPLIVATIVTTERSSSAETVEAMAKGEVAAYGNVEIVRLTINWAIPRVQPCLLCLEIHSLMGKRWREITYDCVPRIRRDDSGGILLVMRLVDGLVDRPDVGFIFRILAFQCCGRHVVSRLLCKPTEPKTTRTIKHWFC